MSSSILSRIVLCGLTRIIPSDSRSSRLNDSKIIDFSDNERTSSFQADSSYPCKTPSFHRFWNKSLYDDRWVALSKSVLSVGMPRANHSVLTFCRIKRNSETFFSHQFCTFRFSVANLNLKTDRNLEVTPKPAHLQTRPFCRIKRYSETSAGRPEVRPHSTRTLTDRD